MLYFVYELVDPRTDTAAYVGITDNPNQRFRAHLKDVGTNDKKCSWIEQLKMEHLEPRMRILEIVETREEAMEREKHWVQHYLQRGIPLTNISLATTKQEHNIKNTNIPFIDFNYNCPLKYKCPIRHKSTDGYQSLYNRDCPRRKSFNCPSARF